jgi:hypothetical protein
MRIINYINILTAGLMLMLYSCGSERQGTALITGRIDGGAGMMLKLEELDPMGSVPLDSVVAGSDGSFRFAINPKEAGFYILRTADNRMTVLTARPGDTLNVTGNAVDFPMSVTVTGSEDARLLGEFYAFSYRQKARSDSLQALLEAHRGDSLFTSMTLKADTVFRQIWDEQRAFGIAFLEQHPASFAGLIVVNYSFGVRPVLSMEEDLGWYQKVDSSLTAKYPGNPHVEFNSRRIEEFRRQVGLKDAAKP